MPIFHPAYPFMSRTMLSVSFRLPRHQQPMVGEGATFVQHFPAEEDIGELKKVHLSFAYPLAVSCNPKLEW